MTESPQQLAVRRAKKTWTDLGGSGFPPIDLVGAVTQVAMAVGYQKDRVDKMVMAFRKAERAQSTPTHQTEDK